MPPPTDSSHLSLSLDALDQVFQVYTFSGTEGISTPYAFDIEVVSERGNLPLQALLQQPAFLAFDQHGAGVHGVIGQVRQGARGKRLSHYHLRLVSPLARLALRVNQRIFQQRTVAQIVSEVLAEQGVLADTFTFRLAEPFAPREYCVQYAESDLAFIERLCQEDGIHYHFVHSAQGQQLVFADHQMFFPQLDQAVPYVQDSGMCAGEVVVNQFAVQLQPVIGQAQLRDYDFREADRPRSAQAISEPRSEAPEHFAYPGGFTQAGLREHGYYLARRALERERLAERLADGQSNQPQLVSGHLLQLLEHPQAECNDRWLLNTLQHEGRQPQVLEADDGGGASGAQGWQGYRNRFTATPWDVFYRPALTRAKPRMQGSQTARVTGPKGEEVFCDEYGRIKVQFHWDRAGEQGEHSSCWLRVMSAWAGARYGAVAVPRVGMEVLVTFLEGDPDQPLVTGCLPNNLTRPPHVLPTHNTRSVFRSRSTARSGGYNELALEDRAGQELIYLRAQRDMEQRVENDSRLLVGSQRHETVQGDNIVQLDGEDQRTVGGDRKVLLRANDHLQVEQASHTRVALSWLQEAGQQAHIKAGTDVVLEAANSISLKVGGQHLLVTAGGIFSSSPVQLGGAPAAGLAVSPVLPGIAAALAAPQVLPVIAPTQQLLLSLSTTHQSDYCPICEACKNGLCLPGATQ